MNDIDELLAELNPMKQWPSPEVGSSAAEAIYEQAMARYAGASPSEPWHKALSARLGGTRRPSRLRRSLATLLLAAVVVLIFVLPIPRLLHLGPSGRKTGTALTHPTTTPGPGATGLRLLWRARVPAGVVSMTLAHGSLWVTGEGAVSRVDPGSGRTIARIAAPEASEEAGVAALAGAIWVSSGQLGSSGGILYEIDPRTNRVIRTFKAPGQPSAMTAGSGLLWIDVYRNGDELRPFDPRTGTFLPAVVATSEQMGAPVYGLGSVWVTSAVPYGRVWKIDPSTMRSSIVLQTPSSPTLPLYNSGGPAGITTEAGALWVSFSNGTEIARVNPRTGSLEDIFAVTRASGTILEGVGGLVWVLFRTGSSSSVVYDPDSSMPGGVGRIDPRTDTFIGAVLRIGDSGGYDSLVASGTRAWVGDNSKVIALGT